MVKNYFKGRHFQKDIILVAVGYYFRFSLSYRDIVWSPVNKIDNLNRDFFVLCHD